jgi:hypothetical protein
VGVHKTQRQIANRDAPPGLRTRRISRKTLGLSGARLITQLLMTQSTELSAKGSGVDLSEMKLRVRYPDFFSASPSPFNHLGCHVDPQYAFPKGPTFPAARKMSIPPPQPRSTTTSPGRRLAKAVGIPQGKSHVARPVMAVLSRVAERFGH